MSEIHSGSKRGSTIACRGDRANVEGDPDFQSEGVDLGSKAIHRSLTSVHSVCSVLKRKFGTPRHFNKSDPFNELIFIVCSLRTMEQQYLAAYARVKKAYPRHVDILNASETDLGRHIGDAGLGAQKARCLIECAKTIDQKFGRVTLSPLKLWNDSECESFLTSLPRIGLKSARCIMMYSLDRKVFPVDTHCWRIGKRLGWVRDTTSDGQPRDKEMNRYQKKIPPLKRYSLHVGFVALGREYCLSRNPYCEHCPLKLACKRLGVKRLDR